MQKKKGIYMKNIVILKCSAWGNCEKLFETSNIDPYLIVDVLSSSSILYSIDQNHKTISKMTSRELIEYSNDQISLRKNPDLILVDNPFGKEIEDISNQDFETMMQLFSSPESLINVCFPDIQNSMVLYAHDYNFYVAFYSNIQNVTEITCNLLNRIFSYSGNKISIKNNDKIIELSKLLKNGISINVKKSSIKERTLSLMIHTHNESKFGDILFSNVKSNNFFKFNLDIQ